MELMDLHSHILPHMDHGCTHTETGVAQLALIHKAGVSTVCATSHFYPQRVMPNDYLEARRHWLDHLLNAVGDAPRPAIIPSAEVLICEGMEHMEGLPELCYEGTNVLLLEMPLTQNLWNSRLYDTVAEIRAIGLRPVLAHVDRYPEKLIRPLLDMGIEGQINADALDGLFKPRHLLQWMDEGRIVGLGSDLHKEKAKGYAPFQKVVASMPDRVARIMEASAALLKDAVRY